MNNKLFTNISLQEQENTSGGADISSIPIISTFPSLIVDAMLLNPLINEIVPSFGSNLL